MTKPEDVKRLSGSSGSVCSLNVLKTKATEAVLMEPECAQLVKGLMELESIQLVKGFCRARQYSCMRGFVPYSTQA